MHAEVIRLQQVVVNGVIKKVLMQILKEMCRMELRLILQMNYAIDSRQKQLLRNLIMNYKQVIANITNNFTNTQGKSIRSNDAEIGNSSK